MRISGEKIDGIDVLRLEGRFDATSAKEVKDRVRSLVQEKRVNLVVDMGAVDFIDSSGLGSLVASLRSVNKLGGDIRIASIQDQVRAIFELTRLHRIFEIFDDSTTAAKSF